MADVDTTIDVRARWKGQDLRRGTSQADRDLNRLRRTADRVGSAMKQIGAAMGIAFGAMMVAQIGRAAYKMSQMAAQSRAVEIAFNNIARAGGRSPQDLMRKIGESTQFAFSRLEQMRIGNVALSSGIKTLVNNLDSVIRNIRIVSTALGRDFVVDIERTISAINKQEQELLDELGIVARVETAYRRYADEVNRTVKSLTDLEKREAFAALVIEQLEQKARGFGGSEVENKAALHAAQIGAAFDDVSVGLGKMLRFDEELAAFAKDMQAIAKAVTEMAHTPGGPFGALMGFTPRVPGTEFPGLGLITEEGVTPKGRFSRYSRLPGVVNTEDTAIPIRGVSVSQHRPLGRVSLPPIPEVDDGVDMFKEFTDAIELSSRNLAVETALVQKRNDLYHAGLKGLDRELNALRRKQIAEDADLAVMGASEKQRDDLAKIHAEESKLYEKLFNDAQAARDALGEFNEKVAAASVVVSEVAPRFGQLAGAIANIASKNYWIGGVQAFFLLLDLLGGSGKDAIETHRDALLDEMDAADRAAQAVNRLASSITSMVPSQISSMTQGGDSLQALLRAMEMAGFSGDRGARIGELFEEPGPGLRDLAIMLSWRRKEARESGEEIATAPEDIFTLDRLTQLLADIEHTFGELVTTEAGIVEALRVSAAAAAGDPLGTFGGARGRFGHVMRFNAGADAGQQMGLLRASFAQIVEGMNFENLTWAHELVEINEDQRRTLREMMFDARDFHDDFRQVFERTSGVMFDAREMALRRSAQMQLGMAGGDVALQSQILEGLRGALAGLAAEERAVLGAGPSGSGSLFMPPTGGPPKGTAGFYAEPAELQEMDQAGHWDISARLQVVAEANAGTEIAEEAVNAARVYFNDNPVEIRIVPEKSAEEIAADIRESLGEVAGRSHLPTELQEMDQAGHWDIRAFSRG